MSSAVYAGSIAHLRLQPFRHAFSYRIFSTLIDLDAVPNLAVFSHNRFNLMAFYNCDHGAGTIENPKDWVVQHLRSAGHPADGSWRIELLCFPRLLGFVFNPLAIYFCHDGAGTLRAVLHQVSNTFGERHSYLLPVDTAALAGTGRIEQRCAKHFHVSPFMPVDGSYRFRLAPPGDQLDIAIDYLAPDGSTRLIATQRGRRAAFTNATLLGCFVRHPLMTLKIVSAIHWHALKLWRRGARFYRKPLPPARAVTSEQAPDAYRPQAFVESVS